MEQRQDCLREIQYDLDTNNRVTVLICARFNIGLIRNNRVPCSDMEMYSFDRPWTMLDYGPIQGDLSCELNNVEVLFKFISCVESNYYGVYWE